MLEIYTSMHVDKPGKKLILMVTFISKRLLKARTRKKAHKKLSNLRRQKKKFMLIFTLLSLKLHGSD